MEREERIDEVSNEPFSQHRIAKVSRMTKLNRRPTLGEGMFRVTGRSVCSSWRKARYNLVAFVELSSITVSFRH